MGEAKRKASQFVAQIDEVELAVRLAEIAIDLKRPPGKTAAECIADLEFKAASTGVPEAMKVVRDMRAMSRAAILYFGECIAKGQTPS